MTEQDINYVKRPRGNTYAFLCEFNDSDEEIMEVKEYHHKDAKSCATSLNNTAKRYPQLFGNIYAISRKERVFLIKEPIVK
jgi:hypothetical protein